MLNDYYVKMLNFNQGFLILSLTEEAFQKMLQNRRRHFCNILLLQLQGVKIYCKNNGFGLQIFQ